MGDSAAVSAAMAAVGDAASPAPRRPAPTKPDRQPAEADKTAATAALAATAARSSSSSSAGDHLGAPPAGQAPKPSGKTGAAATTAATVASARAPEPEQAQQMASSKAKDGGGIVENAGSGVGLVATVSTEGTLDDLPQQSFDGTHTLAIHVPAPPPLAHPPPVCALSLFSLRGPALS